MLAQDGDKSKYGTSAANIGLWNVNYGLIQSVNPNIDPYSLENDIGGMVTLILQGLNQYGLKGWCDLIRKYLLL